MKEKTLNAQLPTSNVQLKAGATPVIEWAADDVRVNELRNANYGATRDVRRYDLEDFAVSIVELTESCPTTRAGNHIAGQLLRCGTSPLSNHGEVEAAESRRDFLHKLRICLKELRETRRWLRLASRLKKFGRVAGVFALALAKSMNLSESSLPVFGPLRETPNDARFF
jgi:four helix bundle protein